MIECGTQNDFYRCLRVCVFFTRLLSLKWLTIWSIRTNITNYGMMMFDFHLWCARVQCMWSRFVHYQAFFSHVHEVAIIVFIIFFFFVQFCTKFMACIRNSTLYSGLWISDWLWPPEDSNIVWSKLNKNISHQNKNDKWIVRNMCNIVFMAKFRIFFASHFLDSLFRFLALGSCSMFSSQKLSLAHMMLFMFVWLFF